MSVLFTGLLALALGPYLSLVVPGLGENAGVPRPPLLCLTRHWSKRVKAWRESRTAASRYRRGEGACGAT
jgi:hypothetical protein